MERPHKFSIFVALYRRGGRAVKCGGLENRCGVTPTGGSNPSLSAIFSFKGLYSQISDHKPRLSDPKKGALGIRHSALGDLENLSSKI